MVLERNELFVRRRGDTQRAGCSRVPAMESTPWPNITAENSRRTSPRSGWNFGWDFAAKSFTLWRVLF